MDGGLPIDGSGTKDGGGEVGMIRGVGEVLAFEAEAVLGLIGLTLFSRDRAVEKVTGVELYPWLRREDVHPPP